MSQPEREPRRIYDPTSTVIDEAHPHPKPHDVQEQPGIIKVEVMNGPMDGLTRATKKEELTLGRRDTNDLPLPMDPMISGLHAKIVRKGVRYWIEDMGSRNGTYIGEERLARRTPIAPGMMFTVGHTSLELLNR